MVKSFLISILLFSSLALAGSNQVLTYQGVLTDSSDNPYSTTQTVDFAIYSPSPSSCLLYSETQSITPDTKGRFSAQIGTGTRTDGGAHTFNKVFVNGGTLTGLTCGGGGTSYTGGATDDRVLAITVNGVTLTPSVTVKSVPFAMQAHEIDGWGLNNLVKVSSTGSATTFTTSEMANVKSIAGSACATSEILKWNGSAWSCSADATGSIPGDAGYTGSKGLVAFDTNAATSGITVTSGIAKLSDTGVAAATYGTASKVSSIQVNAQGRILTATEIPIALPASQISQSGANSGEVLKWNGSGWIPSADNTGASSDATYSSKGIVQANTDLATSGLNLSSGVISVNTGTGSNQIVKLDASGKLPGVDASAVTNLSASNVSTGTLSVNRGGTGAGSFTANSLVLVNGLGTALIGMTCAPNEILKWSGSVWNCAADATGGAPGDATYAAKGLVQFNTDAATSGILLSTGVATVNSGTGANQIVKLDGSSRLPAVDASLLTNLSVSQISSGSLSVARGGTGLTSGISGGIPYFNSTSTMASSTALTANGVVLGGGAGAAPTATAAGSADQVLRIPSGGGTPAFGAIDLTKPAAVTGALGAGNGGTGFSTYTPGDLLYASAPAALSKIAISGTNGNILMSNGTAPQWKTTSTAGLFQNNGNSFGAAAVLGTNDANSLSFETGNTVRMIIDTAGKVAIGGPTGVEQFYVVGNSRHNGELIVDNQTGGASRAIVTQQQVDVVGPSQLMLATNRSFGYPSSGDKLGEVIFMNAVDWAESAKIVSDTSETHTAAKHGANLRFFTMPAGSAQTETERMTITDTGNVGIGTNTPGSALDVKGALRLSGTTSGYAGFKPAAAAGSTVWTLPNADGGAGQFLKTDGSGNLSWATASMAAVTSLNGLTAATQNFAIGSSGTAPNFNSATATHTLNIPMASTVSVTAGLISKTDYDNFSNKLGTAQSFSGDISGFYNTTSVDKIKGISVSTAGLSNGQYLRYSGSAWTNSNIAASDIASGTLPVTRGGTGAGSFTANRLIASDGTGSTLQAITACSQFQVLSFDATGLYGCYDISYTGAFAKNGNSFGATATLGTNDFNDLAFETNGATRMTINKSTGNVGIQTSTPRVALDVSGAIAGSPALNVGATTVDFLGGNLARTSLPCQAFNLYNLKDGATYTFAIQNGTSATCSFNAYSDGGSTVLTVKMPPDHGPTISGKDTVYTFLVLGTTAYVSWVPGY